MRRPTTTGDRGPSEAVSGDRTGDARTVIEVDHAIRFVHTTSKHSTVYVYRVDTVSVGDGLGG
jgi:hypothetical protein